MWFNARVRLNLYILMEEWLRKAEVPFIYHEYHFYNLKTTIDDFNKMTYINNYVDRSGKLDKPLSPEYDTFAHDDKCTWDDVYGKNEEHVIEHVDYEPVKYNIWLTLLELKINFVEKAVQQKNMRKNGHEKQMSTMNILTN